MPDLPFEYHPSATVEAHAAYHWYAERSEEVADRFWDERVRARRMLSVANSTFIVRRTVEFFASCATI